jgi:hypothetical protein
MLERYGNEGGGRHISKFDMAKVDLDLVGVRCTNLILRSCCSSPSHRHFSCPSFALTDWP